MLRIIKTFLLLWAVLFGILIIVSCTIYKEQIYNVVAGTWWAVFNEFMPILFILLALAYIIKKVFE